MPKTRYQKEKIVQDLKEKFETSYGYFLINLVNLGSSIQKKLQDLLKENNALLQVVKKTLIYKANNNFPFSDNDLKTSFAFAWFFDENLSGLRAFKQLQQENIKIEFLKSYIFNQVLPQEKIIELINLPSREELLQKLVIQLRTPIYRLHHHLNFPLRKLIFVLSSIKK